MTTPHLAPSVPSSLPYPQMPAHSAHTMLIKWNITSCYKCHAGGQKQSFPIILAFGTGTTLPSKSSDYVEVPQKYHIQLGGHAAEQQAVWTGLDYASGRGLDGASHYPFAWGSRGDEVGHWLCQSRHNHNGTQLLETASNLIHSLLCPPVIVLGLREHFPFS